MLQSAQISIQGGGTTQYDRAVGHIVIESVTPVVDGGRYPVRRIAGEPCVVEADAFRDGHQIIGLALTYRRNNDESFSDATMAALENDRWRGQFIPTENTRYIYTVEAWTDLFASWLSDFRKKVLAGRDVRSDLLEGKALIERMARSAYDRDRELLSRCLEQLESRSD